MGVDVLRQYGPHLRVDDRLPFAAECLAHDGAVKERQWERCWGLDLWPPPDREEVVKSVYHADRLPLTLSLEGHAWGGWISTGQVSVGELERGGGPRVPKKER